MVINEKKNVLIVSLLVAVVFMSVGYALLSAKSNSNNSVQMDDPIMNVEISNVRHTETSGMGDSLSAEVINVYTAGFSFKLTGSMDSVTHTVTVVNNGNMDAMLDSFLTNPMDLNSDEYIVYTITGLDAGDLLPADSMMTFSITARYNDDATGKPKAEDLEKDFTVTLNYIQAK